MFPCVPDDLRCYLWFRNRCHSVGLQGDLAFFPLLLFIEGLYKFIKQPAFFSAMIPVLHNLFQEFDFLFRQVRQFILVVSGEHEKTGFSNFQGSRRIECSLCRLTPRRGNIIFARSGDDLLYFPFTRFKSRLLLFVVTVPVVGGDNTFLDVVQNGVNDLVR